MSDPVAAAAAEPFAAGGPPVFGTLGALPLPVVVAVAVMAVPRVSPALSRGNARHGPPGQHHKRYTMKPKLQLEQLAEFVI